MGEVIFKLTTMKIIQLNEEQFLRLFEDANVPNFNGGDIKEYPGSEVSSTSSVHDNDGELEYGIMPDTDKFSHQQTPQQWGARHGRTGFGR